MPARDYVPSYFAWGCFAKKLDARVARGWRQDVLQIVDKPARGEQRLDASLAHLGDRLMLHRQNDRVEGALRGVVAWSPGPRVVGVQRWRDPGGPEADFRHDWMPGNAGIRLHSFRDERDLNAMDRRGSS